jgi:serine/threonine-protein kinase
MNWEPGARIGDYEVVSVLGAGGMGKVYKVRNLISDRIEAMKVLLPNLESEPELADRFLREIKVQASLVHPNIASLHTAQRVGNQLLMLMEFVEGETLEQKAKRGPVGVREAAEYISQVLAALAYAHGRGVVHRDIKPANMMLTPGGVVKLMDFGIAKAATDRRLTMTGTTMGSLYYMSPEQIQGATNLDARADIYSVGVSLYELLTGKRPFDGDSQFAIMTAHLEKQPVPPIALDPTLPQALNDIVLMAVAKDPGQRFQSADAFRNALRAAASSPAAAPAPTVTMPPVRAAKGRRGLYVAAGALAMALAAVGVIQFGPWKSTSAGQPPLPVSNPPVGQTAAELPSAQQPPEPKPALTQPPAERPNQGTTRAGAPAAETTKQPRASMPEQRETEPLPQPQVAAPPPQQTTTPPQQTTAPSVPTAAADPARAAELQETRERLVQLAARAGAVKSGLDNLRRAQAATGLGLRGDMVEALNSMDYLMQGATSAVNAGDAPAAKRLLANAERQIEKLEKFLGR